MPANAEFNASATPEATFVACADWLVGRLAEAIRDRGVARIALAGGSTPRRLYQILADRYRDALEWPRVEFYFGDERNVPLDHPDSNFRMARQALFEPLGIQPHRTFPMVSDQQRDPERDAQSYEETLRRWTAGEVPRFDVALVGLGSDGHFASLFPDTEALSEHHRLVVVNPVPKLHGHRLTLTFPVFESARDVVFLVLGADKAPAIQRIRDGGDELPAEDLARRRPTRWFVDQAAYGTA
ncbi:MAG: 6-phosphogluconolactonase [Halothiobacillaceae bacterium]|mgnify:CR=1 FL=1|nr:6-phosphogluconolactonase [Halothiobacillaceae bacterium]HER34720.1 6-phosphogluconolactonase [Halothiobacillaceae bacterium]